MPAIQFSVWNIKTELKFKRLFMRLAQRTNDLKDAKEFIELNKIQDYEIIIVFND